MGIPAIGTVFKASTDMKKGGKVKPPKAGAKALPPFMMKKGAKPAAPAMKKGGKVKAC